MRLATKDRHFHQSVVVYISEIVNGLLYALCLVGVVGMAVGVYFAGAHLYANVVTNNHSILETLVVDIITVLAVVEVIRTILSYLSEGRVRVSLIIDTAMIITFNGIIRQWFVAKPSGTVLYFVAAAIVLMVLRILAIRYGPSRAEKA